MPGARPRVGAERAEVDGEVPAGLRAVDEHERTGLVRDVGDVGDGLDRAGDVAGVLADDRARRGLGDERLDRRRRSTKPVVVGLGEHDLDAALRPAR